MKKKLNVKSDCVGMFPQEIIEAIMESRGVKDIDEFQNPSLEKHLLPLDDLKNADEVFITNSLMGIMKVKKFEDIEYNNNKIIENVQLAYQEAIQKQGAKDE